MKEKERKRKKDEGERKEEPEKKIVQILTNKKLSAIKAMLEKDHAIDCMFLLLMNKGRWGEAKRFMRKIGKHIADGTFRLRMIEIADLKLATRKKIGKNPNQFRYVITDFGKKLGQLLFDFFDGIM